MKVDSKKRILDLITSVMSQNSMIPMLDVKLLKEKTFCDSLSEYDELRKLLQVVWNEMIFYKTGGKHYYSYQFQVVLFGNKCKFEFILRFLLLKIKSENFNKEDYEFIYNEIRGGLKEMRDNKVNVPEMISLSMGLIYVFKLYSSMFKKL